MLKLNKYKIQILRIENHFYFKKIKINFLQKNSLLIQKMPLLKVKLFKLNLR